MEKKGKNITYASRHMSTLWNPFSYKNTEPKYPDGLAQYSIGQKYVNHFTLEGEDVLLVLFPGLVGSVLAFTDLDSEPIIRGLSMHADNGNLFKRVVEASQRVGTDARDNPDDAELSLPLFTLRPDPKFSAWRPVSYAFKIQPISNHESIECGKDGWWEAIRLQNSINDVEWGVHGFYQENLAVPDPAQDGDDMVPAVRGFAEEYSTPEQRNKQLALRENPRRVQTPWLNGKGLIQPIPDTLQTLNSAEGWTLQPSYSKGNVRDLQCWTFQLNNVRRDNEFIDIRGASVLYYDPDGTNTTGEDPSYLTKAITFKLPLETWHGEYTAEYRGKYTSARRDAVNYEDGRVAYDGTDPDLALRSQRKVPHRTAVEGFHSLYSDAYDVVIVKLHGRANTRYLVQTVANIEYLAFNGSQLQEYTTTSYAALDELSHFLDVRANDYKFPNHNYFRDKLKF